MSTSPTNHAVRRRHRVGRTIVAVLVTVAAAITFVPTVAHADDFGLDTETEAWGGVGSIPDNWNHDYCFDFDTSNRELAFIAYFLWTGYESVMQSTMYNSGYEECNEETDVVFRIDNTINAVGRATCEKWTPDGKICNSNAVLINLTSARRLNDHQLIKLSCHEVGHTIGLSDGPSGVTTGWWNDCMMSGTSPGGDQFETLNRHHIDHANSRAPYNDARHATTMTRR